MAWANMWWDWITPELVLEDWRQRIERVAQEEASYFGGLPYVTGVAVIGTVGRGDPWPLSDVDLLIVTDLPHDRDAQEVIRRVEMERRQRLERARIPVEVEAYLWAAIRSDELAQAAGECHAAFLRRVSHWYWRGVVIKAQGARVIVDSDGQLTRFVERCNETVYSDGFLAQWVQTDIDGASENLSRCKEAANRGEWEQASVEGLLATGHLVHGHYGVWRRVPQSITRFVTRFEAAADEAAEGRAAQSFMLAARLGDEDVERRFESQPPSHQKERDVVFEIRGRTEEGINVMAVTRDLLHATAHIGRKAATSGPDDGWEHIAHNRRTVETQLDALEELLGRLRSGHPGMPVAG